MFACERVCFKEREREQTNKVFCSAEGRRGVTRGMKTRGVGDDDVKEDMDDVADFLFRMREYGNIRTFQQIN